MKAGLLIQMALTFMGLSLMAVGGVSAIIPELHHQTVEVYEWMDDTTFANLFAITQVAPGSNMLVISLIGLYVAGWQGLMVTTLGFMVPSALLAVLSANIIGRFEGTWQLLSIKIGLIPVGLGLFVAGGVVICRVSDHDMAGVGFSMAGAAFALFLDKNPLWVLSSAAVVGAALSFF